MENLGVTLAVTTATAPIATDNAKRIAGPSSDDAVILPPADNPPTIVQRNLADPERASTMPLWFMAFGGTVPIGNLIFGPVMDAVGARWVLIFGAVCAVALAWWGDLKRLDEDDFLAVDDGGEPFRPVNANRLF